MSEELALPGIGALVNLSDRDEVATAYRDVQALEAQLAEAKRVLRSALAEEAARVGSKTLPLKDGWSAVVGSDTRTFYDVEALSALLDAGLPAERYNALVTETVEYKVDAREAKRIAKANPKYAEIIEAAATTREISPGLSFRR